MVLGAPELGCYEELVARHSAALEGSSQMFLGPVSICRLACIYAMSDAENPHHSRVNVTVSGLDSLDDGLFLGMFVLPGAEPHCWDFGPGIQLEFCGHFEC
mgnify:CR=1 FL=1